MEILARIVLFVLATLFVAKFLSFGIIGYAGVGMFIEMVPVLAPGMGIGVDYAIYVLTRLQEEIPNYTEVNAYIRVLSTSGKAVFYTAFSVAIGIFILVFSPIRLQALMGAMLSLVLFANMLSALLFLPSMVSIVKPAFIYGNGK